MVLKGNATLEFDGSKWEWIANADGCTAKTTKRKFPLTEGRIPALLSAAVPILHTASHSFKLHFEAL